MISASDPRDPRAATRIDDEGVWSSHAENQQWIDVVAQSMPRVRSYIRRVSKDDDEIVDLIADTRLLAWVGRAELLAAPAPADLILRYAREACRAWVALRRREVALDEVTVAATLSEDAVGCDSMSVEEAEKWQAWFVRVLSCLSMNQRLAVDYRYRWSWNYEFVAAAMECTKATARVHAHRGLRRLRTIVAHEPPPLLGSNRE